MSSRRPPTPRAAVPPARAQSAGDAGRGVAAPPRASVPPPASVPPQVKGAGAGAAPSGSKAKPATKVAPVRAPGNGRKPPTRPGERRGPRARAVPQTSSRPEEKTRHFGRNPGSSRIEFAAGDGGRYSISWQALIMTLVLAMAFVLLAPTLRLYLRQQAMESAVNEQVAAAEARNAALNREIARWSDPAFVETQARERLGFIMPGQQNYLVIDPEVVVGEDAQAQYEELHAQPSLPTGPWYFQIWDSIQVAGSTAAVNLPAVDGSGGNS